MQIELDETIGGAYEEGRGREPEAAEEAEEVAEERERHRHEQRECWNRMVEIRSIEAMGE